MYSYDADENVGDTSDDGTTNASGLFTTRELAPGTYQVNVSTSDWQFSKSQEATVTANTDGTAKVTIDGAQVLKGKVTAGGKAVTKGTVQATTTKGAYYQADLKNGEYSLLVKPGTYTVSAVPPWEGTKTWLTTYAGSTVRQVDSKGVKVTSAKAVTLNIAAYSKLGKITGVIRDSKGKALKGVYVSAYALNRSGGDTAITDSKGKYTLTGLPADKYSVSAGSGGFGGASLQGAEEGPLAQSEGQVPEAPVPTAQANAEAAARVAAASYNYAAKTVKVTAGKTASASLKLKKTATYKGKIILTLKAPKSLVKAGNACATAFNSKGGWAGTGCITTKSKKITFDGLKAGKYKIALDGANSSKTVTVKKNKTVKTKATRVAGTTLSGKITSPSGKALKGATVSVSDANGTALRSVSTNSKGKYKIKGVVKGKYQVRAWAPDQKKGATVVKSKTMKGKKATQNIKLKKPGTITGKVVNSKGKPVAGVSVWVSGPLYGWASTVTNSKGAYKLTGLVGGKYRVMTADYYTGGYFNGKSSRKSVGVGKTVKFGTIKLKG